MIFAMLLSLLFGPHRARLFQIYTPRHPALWIASAGGAGGLMGAGMTPGLGETVVNNYYGSDSNFSGGEPLRGK
jgi:hypothetical protein